MAGLYQQVVDALSADATSQQGAPAGRAFYETALSPAEERDFQRWKQKYAPRDSGADYDLRGAYKAGVSMDPANGHWPDTFKKPNHPTFSVESQYARYAPELAGMWVGPKHDVYLPPPPVPASWPPAGANAVNPFFVPPIPAPSGVADFGNLGTRNEGIYPTR